MRKTPCTIQSYGSLKTNKSSIEKYADTIKMYKSMQLKQVWAHAKLNYSQ